MIRLLTIFYLCCAINVSAQIVCQWSNFETNGQFWFAPNDNPWTYTFPGLVINPSAWKSVADNSEAITQANLVTTTVNLPTGGGVFDPTYTATNTTVARLQPGSGYIDFTFADLPPSTLELRIIGCSTNPIGYTAHNGWTTTNPPDAASVRRPLIFKWVWQEAGVQTNTHRVFAFYDSNVWQMASLAFSALRYPGSTNTVTARLSIDSDSTVSADVWMFWLYANSDFSSTELHKSLPTTFSASDHAYDMSYAETTAATPYSTWRSGSPAIPEVSSQSMEDAFHALWPGLNVNGHEVAPFASSENWVGYPSRPLFQYWYESFAMTNSTFGQSFGHVEYNDGTAPLPWIWDAGNANWLSGWGYNAYRHQSIYSPIYSHLMTLINGDTANGTGNHAPATRWHYFPDQTNIAHLAALEFSALAVQWPAINYENNVTEIFDNDSPYLGYTYSSQTQRRKGKFAYDGWMGANVDAAVQQLDYLWAYISTNTALAQDVTTFIPYIGGDTNLLKRHFERFLFDSMYREYNFTISRGDPWTLGLVMQSGTQSETLMNGAVTSISIVPDGGGGAKHQYASSIGVNGTHRVGSLFYESGSEFLGAYRTFSLYKEAGGTPPYDFSDLTMFPKIVAFTDWQAQYFTAGYPPSRGDASRLISEGRNPYNTQDWQEMWRVANAGGSQERFRIAKYVADVAGQGALNGTEWASVQSQASQASMDIRYAQESRAIRGMAMLERGVTTTNAANRGSAVMATDVGYGHDHADHLDLNIFMHGARLLSDFGVRNENANVMYPKSFTPQVHNVLEVGGYIKPDDGSTEGHNSHNFLFSTGIVAQVMGAWAWSSGTPAYNHFSRLVSMVDLDSTNSYVVSVQRMDAGTWDVSYGAGTTAMGPTNDFTSSLHFTNLLSDDNIEDSDFRPTFKLRKHSWSGDYSPAKATASPTAHEWFQWHLASGSGSASMVNLDGNGGAVSWSDASGNMGANTSTYLKLHLFDRTNDMTCFADAFSDYYNFVSRRVYSLPNIATTNAQPDASGVWMELWEPFVGSAYITSTESVAQDTTTDYTGQKGLRVQGSTWEDLHLFDSVGTNRVGTIDAFTSDGLYALYRTTNSAFKGLKVVGGFGATNGNFSLTLATNRVAATISSVSYPANSFSVSDWPAVAVKKTGWYRIWNATHETEYYLTNFNGSTAKWRYDALIGTCSVSPGYSSGNTIAVTSNSFPVLAYPKRWSGLSFANEANTVHFRGNCTNSPVQLTRTDGDTPSAASFSDLDGDGWVEARIYDFGNGDTVEVPSEASLEVASNGYTVTANVETTVSVTAQGSQLYLDGHALTTSASGGVLTATLPANLLTGGRQQLNYGARGSVTTLHAGTLK